MNLALVVLLSFCCPCSTSAASNLTHLNGHTIVSLEHLKSLLAEASANDTPYVLEHEKVTDSINNLLAHLNRISPKESIGVDEELAQVEVSQATTKGGNYSKGRVLSVIGAATLILALSIFGVFLPDIIKWIMGTTTSEYSSTRIIVESLCNSFAAGGFWGLALIHVLKEAIDHLDSLRWGMNVGNSYCNGAYLLICTGYLVMLMVEAFASTTSQKQRLKRGMLDSEQQSLKDRKKAAILDASVASLALTFHAIFEGMVIGMRPTGVLVWVATTSVAGHKWAEAFALSQRMSSNDLSKSWRTIFLSTFLLSTPVGALLGLPLGAFQDSPISGIMSSLSCGVLVYVAGECTSDIFHSHRTHCDTVPRAISYADQDTSSHLSCSVAEMEDGHQGSVSQWKPRTNIEASYRVLLGRLLLMICGMTLLAGMMFVELKTNSAIAA